MFKFNRRDNVATFVKKLSFDQRWKLRQFFVELDNPGMKTFRVQGDALCQDIDDEDCSKLIDQLKQIVGPKESKY